MSNNIRKDGPYSWFYLAATCVVSFTLIGFGDATGIIVAVFIDHFNESNAKGGWLGSIVFFMVFLCSPIVVYIHRRVGFRWCMCISSVMIGFSLSVTPFMTNFYLLLLTYSIPLGAAASFAVTLSITTQREYFSKYFGFAVGLRFSANALGGMVHSFVLPIIFAELGFKMAFLSLLVMAPLVLCYGFVARHHVLQDTENRRGKSVIHLYKEFLQDKSFTICLVGLMLYFGVCIIPMVFMVRYGVILGYTLSKAKWLLVVRGITTFITRLIAGRVSDIALRHGKVKKALQATIVLFGVLNLVCSFLHSFPLLLVYMAFIGVVDAVWWVTYTVLVMEITGGYHFNEAFALVNLAGALSLLFGPPAAGWIYDQTGDFRYVFYTTCGVSLLAAFLLAISSRVRVDKELSLVEKSKRNKEEIHFSKIIVDTNCLSESVDQELSLVEETERNKEVVISSEVIADTNCLSESVDREPLLVEENKRNNEELKPPEIITDTTCL